MKLSILPKNLTDEIKKNKFFEGLKEGLEEVLAHTQGKLTLHSEDIAIPEPPIAYSEKEIQKIRKS